MLGIDVAVGSGPVIGEDITVGLLFGVRGEDVQVGRFAVLRKQGVVGLLRSMAGEHGRGCVSVGQQNPRCHSQEDREAS